MRFLKYLLIIIFIFSFNYSYAKENLQNKKWI